MLEKYEFEIFSKCNYNLFIHEDEYHNYLHHLYDVYARDNQDTDE